jgi:hypothetical protein
MDELYLGATPFGEDCAQVGSADYADKARKECRAFINQLKRVFGEPPPGSEFQIKSNPHDFGTYYEVVIKFDEKDTKAVDYAFHVESHQPEEWDEEAKRELGLNG